MYQCSWFSGTSNISLLFCPLTSPYSHSLKVVLLKKRGGERWVRRKMNNQVTQYSMESWNAVMFSLKLQSLIKPLLTIKLYLRIKKHCYSLQTTTVHQNTRGLKEWHVVTDRNKGTLTEKNHSEKEATWCLG